MKEVEHRVHEGGNGWSSKGKTAEYEEMSSEKKLEEENQITFSTL